MSNNARFGHKIVSGRALIYLSTKLLINQSSTNSSRKLNDPISRIDLFKSSLVYSGPALWNSLPSEMRLPVSPSVFKMHLMLHMLSLLGVTWNHDHRYIYISMCSSNLCCAVSGSPYILCVGALCACSFPWQTCPKSYVRAHVYICLPQIKLIFICIYLYLKQLCSLSTCFSVYWCPFQHGLYECTCTQHTVAHCILS